MVAADIAVYKSGPARPTGGAGAVAILLGHNAPITFNRRYSHFAHVYDFYKPDLHSEYPVVDGKLSQKCYTSALDICYSRYQEKEGGLEGLDYMCFHSPYTKLVQKSFGRLSYNDFIRTPTAFDDSFQELKAVTKEDSYTDRILEKKFMGHTLDSFGAKTGPTLMAAKNMGNMYCASLYGALATLISTVEPSTLVHFYLI